MRKITIHKFNEKLKLTSVEAVTFRYPIKGASPPERVDEVRKILGQAGQIYTNCTVTWKFEGNVEGYTTTMHMENVSGPHRA